MFPVPIRRLSADVPIPEYKTPGACAFDIAVMEEKTVQPNERVFLRTGLVIAVPEHYVLFLLPRSSNAKKGIVLANGTGLIDQDYCGPEDELLLALHNIGSEIFTIQKYDRLVQGIFLPILKADFTEPETWAIKESRGGFGTTG